MSYSKKWQRASKGVLSWSEINRPDIVFCTLIILRLFGRKKHTILLQLLESQGFQGDLQNRLKELIDSEAVDLMAGQVNFYASHVFLDTKPLQAPKNNKNSLVLTRMLIHSVLRGKIYL